MITYHPQQQQWFQPQPFPQVGLRGSIYGGQFPGQRYIYPQPQILPQQPIFHYPQQQQQRFLTTTLPQKPIQQQPQQLQKPLNLQQNQKPQQPQQNQQPKQANQPQKSQQINQQSPTFPYPPQSRATQQFPQQFPLRGSYYPNFPQQFAQTQLNYTSRIVLPPSQYLQSPQRNQILQSPPRGPRIDQFVLSSPQFRGSLQQPMIQIPQLKQATVVQQPQKQAQKPQAPVPQQQLKPPQQEKEQQQKKQYEQQLPKTVAPEKKAEDLDQRFAEAIKRSKQIVDQHQFTQDEPKKSDGDAQQKDQDQDDDFGQEQDQEKEQDVGDQDYEELALQYEDGFIYRGQGFQPATRHGYGILTDSEENEVYAGHWDNNQYEGEGRLNNLQQEQIENPVDWTDLSCIGNGWANYEGNFHQGKMHGQGLLMLTNGEKYIGEFVDGMIEGTGEFHTYENKVISGVWIQARLQDQE